MAVAIALSKEKVQGRGQKKTRRREGGVEEHTLTLYLLKYPQAPQYVIIIFTMFSVSLNASLSLSLLLFLAPAAPKSFGLTRVRSSRLHQTKTSLDEEKE